MDSGRAMEGLGGYGEAGEVSPPAATSAQSGGERTEQPHSRRTIFVPPPSLPGSEHSGQSVSVGSYRFMPLIDEHDPRIKDDILRMVVQYLTEEGFHGAARTLEDEARVRLAAKVKERSLIHRMKNAILEGDWKEVASLSKKELFKNRRAFLYAVYKQQYMELLDAKEYQLAYTHLTKKLKPLESLESHPGEFRDLCYLLTCSSIHETPLSRNEFGSPQTPHSREALVEQFKTMLDLDRSSTTTTTSVQVPKDRLLHLFRQAAAYQLECSRYHPNTIPRISTLLADYSYSRIPNAEHACLRGHQASIKCVAFVGEEGLHVVSGAGDNVVRMWCVESGECLHSFRGHSARIWDVCSNNTGFQVASASGDGSIKLWDTVKGGKVASFEEHEGDVYSVQYHPAMGHVASGGYDKTVRLTDIRTAQPLKTFRGHDSAVSGVVFNPHGNLIISGSKDSSVKFWDITSGVCVKSLPAHLGEVTSVQCNGAGNMLLSSSKDNSNRLWDLRMTKPIVRYKGHQNTSKNFVRASFGSREEVVVGGSEDTQLYVWDTNSGDLLHTLHGHTHIVYGGVWNEKQSLLASCSDDSTIRLWAHDEVAEGGKA
eukprot:TRINITY_DN9159_c0_g1_i2.p1 TRINITY_DN9159_c0_g1~~TRINITY_DN9159_c0_g1_i2.p1  ORF type:complete len:598 (+),score=111.99 TRINITY_DN9159_c0_g1_i2:64-1857(+)